MDINKLDQLYNLYKFQLLPGSNDSFRIYAYNSNYFSNADIITLKDVNPEQIQKLEAEVEKLGYSVKVRNYKTIEDAEDSLFDGFFNVKSFKNQVYHSYLEYKEKVQNIIFGEYEYINSDYYDEQQEQIKTGNVVDAILQDFSLDGPVLVMLEAAAGFGKTSTSYEVIKILSQDENTKKIPLLTELSRNRQAPIFKYVLYDEINRRFTSLNLELVNKHIIDGKIIVIIDGFDELLKTKSQDRSEDKFEDAEPMLETIKELLHGEAKILLTTRRTAVFSDDDFLSWLSQNSNLFTFKRYSLSSPTIKDWINPTREKTLQKAGLNIKSISNPVLLAYLRSMDDERFNDSVSDIDKIIEDYIQKLMEREKERQDLLMSVEEQKKILKVISRYFTHHDITSEAKDILENKILSLEHKLLINILERYPSGKRPTIEQLLNKLIIHAFLDRKGDNGYQIGFVNDFLLGLFVGENLLDENESWIGTERFIDFILTAYIPRSIETKRKMYTILNKNILDYLDISKRVYIDNYLAGYINRDLEYDSISNLEFRNDFIGKDIQIKGVIFSDCEFHEIDFDFTHVHDCHFIKCTFYLCTFYSDYINTNNIQFAGCVFEPNTIISEITDQESVHEIQSDSQNSKYERRVLEKFWPMGKERFTTHKRIDTLRLGVPPEEREDVDEAIQLLIKREILIVRKGHHSLELNIKSINEIKKILGRW